MTGTVGERPGWRLLGLFWVAVILLSAAGLGTLQVLGPPSPAQLRSPTTPELPAPPSPADPPGHEASPEKPPAAPIALHPLADAAPARIAGPVAALTEPSRAFPTALLPRIAADGRMPRIVYAAPAVQVPAGTGSVALLLGGFGLSDRESRAAIDRLPGPVSFAVSSYAMDISPLLTAARDAGHELLASIPMEPQGYPANDEGAHSLLTGASSADNAANLEWALSRTPGIVGATGASDGMRGERFADIPASFDPVVAAVTARGLLYVDARPGRTQSPGIAAKAIDVVLDDQLGRAEIDARLQALERTAQERGAAIGLVGALRPATIERIAAWTKTLQGRGLVLVPVSAVVNP